MPQVINGTSGNDGWNLITPGTFTLNGMGGVDTLNLGTSLRSAYSITQDASGSVHVDSISAASSPLHATLNGISILTFNSTQDVLDLRTYFGQTTPPATPTYALTAATPSVNEGSSDSITLATTNVAANTVETYAISGIAANRLSSGTLTGVVMLDASGKAVINLGVVANNHTDGPTTATVTIGNNLASTSVSVNDTSLSPVPVATPTYVLTAATASVNEGAHNSITLATTNVAAGTVVTYAISGIAANRLTSGALTGQVTVDASGHAGIDLGGVANSHTDGSTTATITLGSNLASTSVSVNDTSLTPPPLATPTFALSAATTSVNEGAHDSITLTTTNVAAGTIETYAISGIAANRLNSGALTGQVAVDASGKAVIDLGVIANNQTDGATTATITIGNNLASTSVTVNDTSLTPTPTPTPNPTPTAGNDTFQETAGNAAIDGGAGIDKVVYAGNQAGYSITVNANGTETVHKPSGGTDTLTNIERLQFTDTKVAFDISGNAGTVAKILGAVFGSASVSNQQFVGIGLSYLDGATPMSYANLMQLALTAAGATTSTAVVNLLWSNLFGTPPTTAQAAPFVAMINNGSYTAGTLGVMAADLSLNTDNIHLLGLQSTGIHYI
jgi:hypothetical protein